MYGYCLSMQTLKGYREICFNDDDVRIRYALEKHKPLCFEFHKCDYTHGDKNLNICNAKYEKLDYYKGKMKYYGSFLRIPKLLEIIDEIGSNKISAILENSSYTLNIILSIRLKMYKIGLLKSFDPLSDEFDIDFKAVSDWQYYQQSEYWQIYKAAGYKVMT